MAVETAGRLRARRVRFNLFVAFAFTNMADPVSSVAYALEAALATGVEAPSNAVAQLGQLDARGRRRFGQLTRRLVLPRRFRLLKALAAHGGDGEALLPRRFRLVNGSYEPTWGVATLAALAAFLVIIAAGREQAIVHYYAAAVSAFLWRRWGARGRPGGVARIAT